MPISHAADGPERAFMQAPAYLDSIGYLPWTGILQFKGGSISPLGEYQEVAEWVNTHKHRDGFLYPPLMHSVRIPVEYLGREGFNEVELERIPNSERPAHLHKLPASHELSVQSPVHEHSPRWGDAAFLMHLAGYLFGVRLQFHDWWFDGRVPVQSTNNIHVSPSAASSFFSAAYATWRTLDTQNQKLATNILFMNSRTTVYEWDWEQFAVDYMVFDGCYRLASRVHSIPRTNHPGRLMAMCSSFGIPTDQTRFAEIARLRNTLFHETLWDDGQPGTSGSSGAWYEAANLRRLNQRVIAALLGYSGNYISSNWWSLGMFSF